MTHLLIHLLQDIPVVEVYSHTIVSKRVGCKSAEHKPLRWEVNKKEQQELG
jgi:hypothetical protein